MKKIKFIKEPGYTYDLFSLFILYFNKDTWLSYVVNQDKQASDMEYFDRLLDEYLPISDDLRIFFYMTENNKSFMTERYYEPFKEDFISGKYNLSSVVADLAGYDKVIDNIIRFYFRDVNNAEVAEYRTSLPALSKLIQEADYEDDIKSALYAFFIEPIPLIQKLIRELIAKEVVMSQQYDKKYRILLGVQEAFDCDKFIEGLNKTGNYSIVSYGLDELYISPCLHHKNLIYYNCSDNAMLAVVGVDYDEMLESLTGKEESLGLDLFGTAISEKNRVEILDLMRKKGEVSIKDVEEELGFTGTNAYYHVSLMLRIGMLKTRNKGRTVLYRLDKEYFEELSGVIKSYAN